MADEFASLSTTLWKQGCGVCELLIASPQPQKTPLSWLSRGLLSFPKRVIRDLASLYGNQDTRFSDFRNELD